MLYLVYSTCFNEFYVEQLQLFNERLGFTLTSLSEMVQPYLGFPPTSTNPI